VSRFSGSETIWAGGNEGTASLMSGTCEAFVRIQVFDSATTPLSRKIASSSSVRSEKSRSRCLGARARLMGQKRSPLPPAMMHAWNRVSIFSCAKRGDSSANAPAPSRNEPTGGAFAAFRSG
jgi:hypothetical protein